MKKKGKEERKRNKQTNKKTTKKTKKKQYNNNNNKETKQENYMIKDTLVTLLYIEKHAVYFEFLKCFIDIPFVKSVRRISF